MCSYCDCCSLYCCCTYMWLVWLHLISRFLCGHCSPWRWFCACHSTGYCCNSLFPAPMGSFLVLAVMMWQLIHHPGVCPRRRRHLLRCCHCCRAIHYPCCLCHSPHSICECVNSMRPPAMDRDYADLGWIRVCAAHYLMHNRFVNCTGSSGQCHSCDHQSRATHDPKDSVNVYLELICWSISVLHSNASVDLHFAVRTIDYSMLLDLHPPNPFEISYAFDGVADICTILRWNEFENLIQIQKHTKECGLENGKFFLHLDVRSCEWHAAVPPLRHTGDDLAVLTNAISFLQYIKKQRKANLIKVEHRGLRGEGGDGENNIANCFWT